MQKSIVKFLPSALFFSPVLGLLINIIINLSGIYEITDYSSIYDRMTDMSLLKMIMLYCILAPIAEELIFRGVIFRLFRKKFGMTVSALLSAMLFGIYHGNLVQFIYAFVMGLMFAVLLELSKTIAIPIISHSANNALAVFISFGYFDYVFNNKTALVLLLLLLASFVLYWFHLLLIYKKDLGKENNG